MNSICSDPVSSRSLITSDVYFRNEEEMQEDTEAPLCLRFCLLIYPEEKKPSARLKKRQPKHAVIKEMTHMQN